MARYLIARDALGDLTKLGQGGQGILYRAPKVHAKFADSMVFKEYKAHARREVDFDALAAMPKLVEDKLSNHDGQGLITIAAWPCAIVKGPSGPVGFVMPAIPDQFFIGLTTVRGRSQTISEFQHLMNPPSVLSARGITISTEQRYQLVREFAKALSFLHRIGIRVGDISPKNLLFSLKPYPAVYFVDCDAMCVNGVSAMPQSETPEWQVPAGEELATIYSDTYKLGLLALRLLAGDQHTKNPQDVPATTPRPLRQLVTDTLTQKPDQRPLPEAWAYLLRQVIDDAQPKATNSTDTPPQSASPTRTPEPTPVVRSRPSSDRAATSSPKPTPAPNPAPLATGLWLTDKQKILTAAVLLPPLLLIIFIFAIFAKIDTSGDGNSSSSSLDTKPSSSPTPTPSIEQIIRSADVGDCFRESTGSRLSDGSLDILALIATECGSSNSDFRVESRKFFRAENPPPCDDSTHGQVWTGGRYPRVLLCVTPD